MTNTAFVTNIITRTNILHMVPAGKLESFSRDWGPILQLAVTAVGLVSFFLIWRQIKQAATWNKLNTKANYYDSEISSRLEKESREKLDAIGIDLSGQMEPISEEQLKAIIADKEAVFTLKCFLNDYENLASAVNIGTADPDLAYTVHSSRIIRAYDIFAPFVDHLRQKHYDADVYIELEKTAMEWKTRKLESAEARSQEVAKLKAALIKARGAKKKV